MKSGMKLEISKDPLHLSIVRPNLPPNVDPGNDLKMRLWTQSIAQLSFGVRLLSGGRDRVSNDRNESFADWLVFVIADRRLMGRVWTALRWQGFSEDVQSAGRGCHVSGLSMRL